jgi:hypothetical protein
MTAPITSSTIVEENVSWSRRTETTSSKPSTFTACAEPPYDARLDGA